MKAKRQHNKSTSGTNPLGHFILVFYVLFVHQPSKILQHTFFSVATGSSFYVGRRIMEASLCLITPWSLQQSKPRRPRHLPAHPGEVEWTLDRYPLTDEYKMYYPFVFKESGLLKCFTFLGPPLIGTQPRSLSTM